MYGVGCNPVQRGSVCEIMVEDVQHCRQAESGWLCFLFFQPSNNDDRPSSLQAARLNQTPSKLSRSLRSEDMRSRWHNSVRSKASKPPIRMSN